MKKLMTMIAAVATAFGLYAAEGDIDSFDAATGSLTDSQWTLNNEVITGEIPEAAITDSKLVFQTGTKTVGRNFKKGDESGFVPVEFTEAVYLDTYINFDAPFEEVPTVADGAKIAAFVLDNSELVAEMREKGATVSDEVVSTNLYAIAGYWDAAAEEWIPAAFMFNTANAGLDSKVEKRLTVKIYENVLVDDTRMGFRFFLDGAAEGPTDALPVLYVFPIVDGAIDFANPIVASNPANKYLGCEFTDIAATVRGRAKADHQLVVALEKSTAEVSALDFAGKGAIGSLLLTATKPSFIEEDASTIEVDYENAAFASITDNAIYDSTSADKGVITFYDDSQITLTVTPTENYTIVKWFKNNEEETPVATGTSYQFTPVKGDALHVKAYKEEATLTYVDADTNPQTVNCTSVIDAFTTAGQLKDATNIKITLGEFAGEEGVITIADEVLGYGITVTGDVTLDLAGKALKGGSTDENQMATPTINVYAGSRLTVEDSVGDGAILDPDFTEEVTGVAPLAISTYGGTINFSAVTGDKFYTIGTIDPTYLDPTYVSIAGGKFEKTNAKEAIAGALASDDLEVVGDEDVVWTVQAIQGFTATFMNGEEVWETQEKVTEATKPETDPTKADYTFAGWALEGQTDPVTFPYAITADTTFDAVFTAIPYVAQVVVTDGGDKVTNKFTDVALALAAVQAAEAAGKFPIEVTALADNGLTIADGGNTAKIAKDVTIGINKIDDLELWVVFGNLEYSGTIDGKLDADEITMPAGTTTIALGVNAIVTVKDGTALTADSFAAPEGYMVKVDEIDDEDQDYVQFTVKEIVATVQANGATAATPFFDVADALAEVQALEQDEAHFPIGVVACVDDLKITNPVTGEEITLAKNATIGITKDAWVITGTVAGEVTLAVGKSITVLATSTLKVNAPAGDYKVVADTTTTPGLVTYTVVEKTYVAQIVGGESFETFEEAVAALTADDQTIKLLDNTALKAGVTPAYNTTFDMGGYTLDAKIQRSITVSAGKTLNVTNGTITLSDKSYTFEAYGTVNVLDGARIVKDTSSGPVFDVYDGATINVEEGAYINNGGAQQVFRCKGEDAVHTINVKGGEIYGNGNDVFCLYKSNSVAYVTISGGKIWTSESVGDAGTRGLVRVGNGKENEPMTMNLTITGGELTATNANFMVNVGGTLNLTLNDTCKAKFYNDQGLNDYCADGYKAFKAEGSDWYTIVAAQVYRAKLYVDGTETGTIELGTDGEKFAKGEKVVATKPGVIDDTVEPDFAQGKTYYVEKLVLFGETEKVCEFEYDGTTLKKGKDDIDVDLTDNVLTYTVVTGDLNPFGAVYVKEYVAPSPTPDPVDPEKPIDVPAADINKNIGAYLKVPAAVADTNAYLTLFHAVDKGDGTAEIVLTDAATNTLTQAVEAETKAIPVSEIAAGTATEVAVTGATPGLWYQLNAAATLEGMTYVDEVQCPSTGTFEFTKGVAGGDTDTARFFKISVSATKRYTNKGNE